MNINRRKFVNSSLAVAAALGVSPALFAGQDSLGNSVDNAQTNIRLGVIGMGSRGSGLAKIIKTLPGVSLNGVCDVLNFRLTKAGDSLSMPEQKRYTDYRAMLDQKDIDAVLIVTPFSMHHTMAQDAIAAGKHIYCEKTMSSGIDNTKALVAAASKASSLVFQTGHQFRSAPKMKSALNYIKSGYLGQIAEVRCHWNRNDNWRRDVPDPSLERQINWRMYKEYSGGLVAELCSHHIDIVNNIADATPTRVMGMGGIDFWKDGRETFDNVQVLTEYASGMKANYSCLTNNSLDQSGIRVLGSKGTMNIGLSDITVWSDKIEEQIKRGTVDGVSGATVHTWKEKKGVLLPNDTESPSWYALNDFKQAIVNGKQPVSSVISGANVSIVVQMALNALHNGSIQKWEKSYAI